MRLDMSEPGISDLDKRELELRKRPIHDLQVRYAGEFPRVVCHDSAANRSRRCRDPQICFTNKSALRLQMCSDRHVMVFDL